MRQQALELARRPDIVVATPGRLADHIKSSGEDTICGLRRTKVVVLDEADRLLSETFKADLGVCMSVVPKSKKEELGGRQTLLFTATMSDELRAQRDVKRGDERRPLFFHETNTEKYVIPSFDSDLREGKVKDSEPLLMLTQDDYSANSFATLHSLKLPYPRSLPPHPPLYPA